MFWTQWILIFMTCIIITTMLLGLVVFKMMQILLSASGLGVIAVMAVLIWIVKVVYFSNDNKNTGIVKVSIVAFSCLNSGMPLVILAYYCISILDASWIAILMLSPYLSVIHYCVFRWYFRNSGAISKPTLPDKFSDKLRCHKTLMLIIPCISIVSCCCVICISLFLLQSTLILVLSQNIVNYCILCTLIIGVVFSFLRPEVLAKVNIIHTIIFCCVFLFMTMCLWYALYTGSDGIIGGNNYVPIMSTQSQDFYIKLLLALYLLIYPIHNYFAKSLKYTNTKEEHYTEDAATIFWIIFGTLCLVMPCSLLSILYYYYGEAKDFSDSLMHVTLFKNTSNMYVGILQILATIPMVSSAIKTSISAYVSSVTGTGLGALGNSMNCNKR